MNKVIFSSQSCEWETPQWLFDQLDEEFHFTIDVAANQENHKCDRYYTKEDDGLSKSWEGETVWLNPPYGLEVRRWMRKAWEEHNQHGITIVTLVPSRTDVAWFHDFVYGKAEIRFIRGRLRFSNSKSYAPFPSMIVIYRGDFHD